METEAQRRANLSYKKKSVKSILLRFFPNDHELYEKVLNKGKEFGGTQEYIRSVLRRDLNEEQ